ncbi:hypothetical protein SVAN01_01150 [Stagonosporopsis vannaccii]|nr:hypothetical protein SVAN01_01150 [Stagonosporopsis vannaccii]
MQKAVEEQIRVRLHKYPSIHLSTTDVALIDKCGPQQQVRSFNNSLYSRGREGSELLVSKIEYTPLDIEQNNVRLLNLHPSDDVSKHIRCDLEFHSLTDLPPFIAVQNARGYRPFEEAIEVDGKAQLISVALERFLRYLRTRIGVPTRIWVRYACVLEFDAQEQKAHWTREFSDKMYALATEVFDMHEINNRLIENGYFDQIVDARYEKKDKDWCGMPSELVLPRICPVRLGTRPNNDAPTTLFQYMPLDVFSNEIRIICVMPAAGSAAPILMHVAHCPIKCEVTFIALSYCWGTDVAQEKVTLNGQIMFIRKSLADAIRFFRAKNAIIPLWIDAMSINQQDITERSRQIKRMGQIYHNAVMVYSWTGPQSDYTEAACTLIDELCKHPVVRINDEAEFHFGEKPRKLAKMCASLYKLLTRQYFRRSWVLQVAMASNPTIIAGCIPAIGFETFDKAVYNFHAMLTKDASLVSQIQFADPTLGEIDIDMLAYPRKIFYFRHLMSGGSGQSFPFFTIGRTSPGYLEALILARDFECTDPRDRIFAVWNLARDKSGLDFSAEYSNTYEFVYTQFTRAWMKQHKSLDMLGAVECTSTSTAFYHNAPSWCPNWNARASTSSLVRKDYLPTRFMSAVDDQGGELYSADGNMDQNAFIDPLFSFDHNNLHCKGVIIDSVKFLFEDAPDIPAGTAPTSTWRFHCWIRDIEEYFQTHNLATYDDPLRAAFAMFHGDSIAAWPSVAQSGYKPELCNSNERYVCLPAASRHVSSFADSYNRTEARNVVNTVLRGRRPFVSESGYMGLAPSYIGVTDTRGAKGNVNATWHLAVVAGCSVPLVLCARDDGTYELMGTSFVQGWMDGEWIQDCMGAEDPQEFWETIGEGARLVIT